MIKVENIDVWGFEHAIRGMRNPMNSWDKSDSKNGCCKPSNYTEHISCDDCPYSEIDIQCKPYYHIGENDLDLMKRLYQAGTEHRKYLRQIFVSMDITAPLYWWKEFDTYKIGTVSNSCSTMHKIAAKEFELDDFSHEYLFPQNSIYMTPDFYNMGDPIFSPYSTLTILIDCLNACRQKYLETKDKQWWWQLIQLLPSSYNQKRTITMNYENVVTIIKQRTNHKLDEWNKLVEVFKTCLPYIRDIME